VGEPAEGPLGVWGAESMAGSCAGRVPRGAVHGGAADGATWASPGYRPSGRNADHGARPPGGRQARDLLERDFTPRLRRTAAGSRIHLCGPLPAASCTRRSSRTCLPRDRRLSVADHLRAALAPDALEDGALVARPRRQHWGQLVTIPAGAFKYNPRLSIPSDWPIIGAVPLGLAAKEIPMITRQRSGQLALPRKNSS